MESIHDDFQRLTLVELGRQFSIDDAKLLGPYDHFYSDCVYGNEFSTHYVALAYELTLLKELNPSMSIPKIQHVSYAWFSIEEILLNNKVHDHTKAYFR